MDRLPVFPSLFLYVWNAGASAAILGHEATLKMEALAKDVRNPVVGLPYLKFSEKKKPYVFKLP